MPKKLMEYFNRAPRIGTLSTAAKDGTVDSAVFGSPRMTDEKTVVMGLGQNRTLNNLQENPHAVFLIMEPGRALADWKGIRVYLTVTALAVGGPALDTYRQQIAKVMGPDAAKMIHAAVTFEVTGVRPLVDMGQDWQQSI
jgi:hypothetical protein